MIETYKQQYLAQMTAMRKECYNNRDMLQEAINLEGEMFLLCSGGICIDKPRFSDVIARLSVRSERLGGVAAEKIDELSRRLEPLGQKISTGLAGGSGERLTFNMLKTLTCPHSILRNVELTADHMHCEIDLLVITPQIVFCIEVKNYKHDTLFDVNGNIVKISDGKIYDSNLGERIRCREHILRTVLLQGVEGAGHLPAIKSYVVSANSKVQFANEFPYVESYCYSVIANIIDKQVQESAQTEMDIGCTRQVILAAEDIHEYPLDIDVETIRVIFADILATLKCAEECLEVAEPVKEMQSDVAAKTMDVASEEGKCIAWVRKAKEWFKESPVPRYAGSALAGVFIGGVLMKLKYERS
ncbi:MAG: NERD domain-containing protein [Clostridia bacterium]|nr:NERD domain-containing protein [Clostridia bacterium]